MLNNQFFKDPIQLNYYPILNIIYKMECQKYIIFLIAEMNL